MSFALIVIGLAAVMTALNNTWKTAPDGGPGLFPQIAKDFFTEGYLYWVAALVIVGFVGYIPQLRKPADAFLTLILVAMILKNGGVFQQFESAVQNVSSDVGSAAPPSSNAAATTTTAATGLFSGPLGAILLNQQAALGAEPLTTPAPASTSGGSIPLGFGGIGSA